jgi:hypothetical protein
MSSVLLDGPFLGLSFTSCVQYRLCYWTVHSSVLVSRLVFNVVCVTGLSILRFSLTFININVLVFLILECLFLETCTQRSHLCFLGVGLSICIRVIMKIKFKQ